MKKLLFFLLFFLFSYSFAQLDREHWFAPMYDGSNQTNPYQSVYMSTNEITPFKVDIYSNNSVIGSVMLSKGNPQRFAVPRSYIITKFSENLFNPVALGLYLKGEKPLFANLRFSVNQHAEIVTSKGTAGIGTEFFTTSAPIQSALDNVNFLTSILATEDNTEVFIDNFDSTVEFSDHTSRNNFNFTLQKGQSYIIEGASNYLQNWKGFIGAKITSSKPISVTNGNFNGQYVPTKLTSTDILMDQSVPLEKLGKEFILVKGNGKVYQITDINHDQNMERAFIVASANNTNIYVNNGTTPINPTPLNAGQSIVIESENYVNQGNDQYNMYIKSTENIYVFQLLAGASDGNEIATGGYNYIPPLSCYLPKEIDEIGFINENEGYKNNSYSITNPTKLNIITETGATVTVQKNGANFPLNNVDGPYPVLGSSNWVTYSIARNPVGANSVSGNITVISDKAVTAGISAGDGAVGYGGYFAGFSYIPSIIKSEGDCLPVVRLEITKGFQLYQWLIKTSSGYIPAPGINDKFQYFPSQAGIYAVNVQQGSCPEIQTADFKFYNCTTYTNYDYSTCTEQLLTPEFALSSQTINNTTLKIDTPPTKGNVVINADGTITYTANPNAIGTDTFKFSFCGYGTIADCETVQATITLNQIEKHEVILEECSATGSATYDLREAAVTPNSTVFKTYYQTEDGADNELVAEVINNFASFTSVDRFVWVRMKNTFGCVAVARIELKAKLPADVKIELYVKTHCDEDVDGVLDGIYKVDITSITPFVLQTPSDHIVRYYDTLIKANAGLLTNNIKDIFSFTANRSIWIRVEPKNGCDVVIKEILLTTGMKFALGTPTPVIICDNNLDNSENIDLANYLQPFTTTTFDSVRYFDDLTKAQNNIPGQNIPAAQTIVADKTFYYRFTKAGICDALGTLNISFKVGAPSPTLLATIPVCQGSTTVLNVGRGYTNVLWSTGSTSTTINAGVGDYFVDLTNASGCVYRQNVSVIESPKPQWNIASFDGTNCDDDFDGKIQVKFSSITPTLITNAILFTVEYSLLSDFSILLPNDWTYSTNTSVYVRTTSAYCPEEIKIIDFKIGDQLSLIKNTHIDEECDTDFDGIKTVELSNYIFKFSSGVGVTTTYFKTLVEAQKNQGSIPSSVTVNKTGIYYLRFQKNGVCDNIGTLTINIKVPQKSTVLVDKDICPKSTTILDAGAGFSNYLWSTGAITSSIDEVPVGEYWVELTFDGCIYKQNVSVKAVPLPKITGVEIQGGIVTISVIGGNLPYQFSLRGPTNFPYQSSNIFTNVPAGNYTVYVISKDQCEQVTTDINVLRILNVITPNEDGINDILNYSDLLRKESPYLQIFDRYGVSVFKGNKNNSFSWDGKSAGKAVATGTYWYVLQWQEPGSSIITKLTGWVLVKTRE